MVLLWGSWSWWKSMVMGAGALKDGATGEWLEWGNHIYSQCPYHLY